MSLLAGRDSTNKSPIIKNAGIVLTGALSATVAGFSSYMASRGNVDTAVNVSYLMYSLAKYYLGNSLPKKPSVVIGSMPLGTVTELSHAISDRIIRYRARGGVFLAHQDGGNESLRIVGKAFGTNRYLFLFMLMLLFFYGSETKKTFNPSAGVNIDVINDANIAQLAIEKGTWAPFYLDNISDVEEENHLTFPIITKNRIYLNMYIETFSYKESIHMGQNIVEYTIFFRKADPKSKYEFKKYVYPDPFNDGVMKSRLLYRRSNLVGSPNMSSDSIVEASSLLEFTTSVLLKVTENFGA